MLNKEKFKDEIFEIACNGGTLALNRHTGKITSCSVIHCADCEFKLGASCDNECRAWCNSEYEEPEIDWSKVPVDTPIYVTQHLIYQKDIIIPRHFARYDENLGLIHYYTNGETSFTTSTTACASKNIIKLAREEDIEKYIK